MKYRSFIFIWIYFLSFVYCNKLLDTWTNLSKQTVIKCEDENFFNWNRSIEEFTEENSNKNKIVNSYKCTDGETPIEFTFKGKFKDFKLEGPGKLKILGKDEKKKIHPAVQPPTDVCIKLGPASVKEVVGTFKNGTLEGVAKITYLDGHKIIANYKNGIYYGHRRDWNSNGTLVQVTYYNQFHMSPSWNSYGNYLVFSDTTKIKFEDGNENDFDFVFDISTSKAYVGTLINPLQDERVLLDIHEVDLVEDSINTKSCLPRPGLKIKSKADYILLLKYDKKIELGQQKTCSSAFTGKNKDVESVFYSWYDRRYILPEDQYGFLNLWKVKQETSPVDLDKVKIPFISDVQLVDFDYQIFNLTLFNGQPSGFRMLEGSVDQNLKLRGSCILVSLEIESGLVGTHPMLHWTPLEISGIFINGILKGHVRITTTNNNIIFATFRNGVMHGPVFSYGLSIILKDKYAARGFQTAPDNDLFFFGTHFQGFFKNGQAFGHFWIQMAGGGHLHGKVNSDGLISGDNIAYIYPDGETALLGKFEDKVMIEAYHVNIEEYACDNYEMFYVKRYSPRKSENSFYFDPPTNISFGGGGTTPDPYETKLLKLGKSQEPNSGDGVFACQDIPPGRVIAHYSLLMYTSKEETDIYYFKCGGNQSRSDDERRACYKYHISLVRYRVTISLPPELDYEPYPNLGPKVNHHFQFNNSAYGEIEHPRWGVIQGIGTIKPIKEGEEIFTFYDYKKEGFPADYPWYHDAHRRIKEEL